jgi:hypothetical protein
VGPFFVLRLKNCSCFLRAGDLIKSGFAEWFHGQMRCSLPQYAITVFRLQTAKGASIYNTAQKRKSLQSVFNFFQFSGKYFSERDF